MPPEALLSPPKTALLSSFWLARPQAYPYEIKPVLFRMGKPAWGQG